MSDELRDDVPLIPPRNTEWQPQFTPAPQVEQDAELATPSRLYSARRRLVAISISVLALWWVGDAVWAMVEFFRENQNSEARALTFVGVAPILFRMVVSAGVLALAWRWAHAPVTDGDQ